MCFLIFCCCIGFVVLYKSLLHCSLRPFSGSSSYAIIIYITFVGSYTGTRKSHFDLDMGFLVIKIMLKLSDLEIGFYVTDGDKFPEGINIRLFFE